MSEVRPFYHQEASLLQGLAQATSLPKLLHDRIQMILLAQRQIPRGLIAQELGYTPDAVRKWCCRFNEQGVLGLFDAPRSGKPRKLSVEELFRVLESATARPRDLGQPFETWSLSKLRRYLAVQHQLGLSREGLRLLLWRNGLSWKKARSWQQSQDPSFQSMRDAIVALYTDPPEGALVLCLDQKGPVQLRSYPGGGYAPKGKAPRYTSGYVRHGTIYVLGALNPKSGQVWARCFRSYNRLTVIWFLGWLLSQLPAEQEIYLIWDQASPHRALDLLGWLERNYPERVHLRFLPSKAAWLNLIEAWWTIFSRDVLRGAAFESREQFRECVRSYLSYYNAQPTPFVWGRERPRRCFRAGPLRRGALRGRAPAGNLNARFLYRLALDCRT